MENNNATAYNPAKKRIGCRDPMGVKVLDFIDTGFLVFQNDCWWLLISTTSWY